MYDFWNVAYGGYRNDISWSTKILKKANWSRAARPVVNSLYDYQVLVTDQNIHFSGESITGRAARDQFAILGIFMDHGNIYDAGHSTLLTEQHEPTEG